MNAKQLAAERAVSYLKDGMTIGLGTGSTAAFAIEAIGRRVKDGLTVKAVASSLHSEELAKDAGIPLVSFSQLSRIDLYLDGADEVDPDFNLMKGGGGALLREKILAFHSKAFLVIVDGSKMVTSLGKFALPVEVTPFAVELTIKQLQGLGCTTSLRNQNGKPFITDNDNLIIDCAFNQIAEVESLNRSLHEIPGVVETGLFSKVMISRIFIGHQTGHVDELEIFPGIK